MPDVNSAERDEQLGNRLFFSALDWILRHELAHLELDHHTRIADKSLTNLDAETEADLQASKWLKGEFNADRSRPAGEKPTSDELRLEWRALAAGLGLIWVGLFEDAFRSPSPEHPPIAERIFASFEVFDLAEDSFAAELLAYSIKAWIDPEGNWGKPSDDRKTTAKDALIEAIVHLHRYMNS